MGFLLLILWTACVTTFANAVAQLSPDLFALTIALGSVAVVVGWLVDRFQRSH